MTRPNDTADLKAQPISSQVAVSSVTFTRCTQASTQKLQISEPFLTKKSRLVRTYYIRTTY